MASYRLDIAEDKIEYIGRPSDLEERYRQNIISPGYTFSNYIA